MRTISEIIDAEDCTGCTACNAACRNGAISMIVDEKGFYKAFVSDKQCVHCNQCINACPQNKEITEIEKEPLIYACRSKEENIQIESASGGFFYVLAQHILNTGGIVYGAVFDDTFKVHHVAVETVCGLRELQGSKYVQSDLGSCFIEIKDLLHKGKMVLFSGTPCQVGGLLSFLGEKKKNLITVDVICHGTPSPGMWQEYLQTKFKDERIKDVKFRYKSNGNVRGNFPLRFQTNRRVLYEQYEKNVFIKGFIANLYLKDSCYHCRFKGINRESDLTIGDFWGIDKIYPGFSNEKGTSLLFIHSEKGNSLFKDIQGKLECIEIPEKQVEQIILYNPSIMFSPNKNDQYSIFWKEYLSKGFLRTVNKLTRKPLLRVLLMSKNKMKYAIYRALKSLIRQR